MGEAGFVTALDGCRIAWQSDGSADAPPLILSNSLGSSMAMWEHQMTDLSRDYRVIRYDQRGHGASDAPPGGYSLDRLGGDVLDLMDGLGIRRAHFCGVSLGGMTGQWLGYRAPERFDRMVFACTSPFMGPASAWQERLGLVQSNGMAAIADAVVARWLTPTFAAKHPGILDTLRQMVAATPPQGYAGCCAAIRDMDLRATSSLITRPVLVIAGRDDPATPDDVGRALAARIPGSKFEVIAGAHLANVENAENFNAVVSNFLRKSQLAPKSWGRP